VDPTPPRPAEADAYDLAPHPEGGWFRRTWTAREWLRTADDRDRPSATMIQFCLPPGETSAWHRVTSDEVWVWNGAGRVRLQTGGTGARPEADEVRVLGGDHAAGEVLQALVPGGVWQRTLLSEETGMVTCVVSPGFDFADLTMAEPPPSPD
jgi:hypothetical protein